MKKKIFFSILLIITLLGMSFVRAADEEVLTTSEQLNESQKEIVNNDVFEGNNNVNESNKTVYGNLFLCGNKINIESETVYGDAFLFANTVKLSDDVLIDGNLYICASNIEVNSDISRDAYIVGQYIEIGEQSNIAYSLYGAAEEIKVAGIVNRDVDITANEIEIVNSASILGDLNYASTSEAKIDKAVVGGNINFKKQTAREKTKVEIVYEYIMNLLRNIVYVVLVFIFVLLIFPGFIDSSKEYVGKKLLKSLGIGLASIILLPIIIVTLIALNITINFGLLMIPVYIVLFAISETIFVIAVSSKIAEKINNEKLKVPYLIPIVTLGLWFIKQIPYVNSFIIFIVFLMGFGIIIQSLFKKKSK